MSYPRQEQQCMHPLVEWVTDEEVDDRPRVLFHGYGKTVLACGEYMIGCFCDLPRQPVIDFVSFNPSTSADCPHFVARFRVVFCPTCGEKLAPVEPPRVLTGIYKR